jgi:hypothetical protein
MRSIITFDISLTRDVKKRKAKPCPRLSGIVNWLRNTDVKQNAKRESRGDKSVAFLSREEKIFTMTRTCRWQTTCHKRSRHSRRRPPGGSDAPVVAPEGRPLTPILGLALSGPPAPVARRRPSTGARPRLSDDAARQISFKDPRKPSENGHIHVRGQNRDARGAEGPTMGQ